MGSLSLFMKPIEILKKALAKKHPCDPCHAALEKLERENTRLREALNGIVLWAPNGYSGPLDDAMNEAHRILNG
jgi:hypothetical protein